MKKRARKLNKNIQIAFARIRRNGGVICRQASDTDEEARAGGFIYFAMLEAISSDYRAAQARKSA